MKTIITLLLTTACVYLLAQVVLLIRQQLRYANDYKQRDLSKILKKMEYKELNELYYDVLMEIKLRDWKLPKLYTKNETK